MYTIERHTLSPIPTAVVRARARVTGLPDVLAHAYGAVVGYLERAQVEMAGMPFGRYRPVGDHEFELEAGFPVSIPVAGEGEVEGSSLPGGTAATTWHVGPYETIGDAYEALQRWVANQGGRPTDDAWEVYYTDPDAQPDPATWRTQVIQPYDESSS